MTRKIFLIGALFLCLSAFCYSGEGTIAVTKGPLSLPFLPFLSESSQVKARIVNDGEQALRSLLSKECEYAVFPIDAGYHIFQSTNGQIMCVALAGNSNFYFVSSNQNLKGTSNLLGAKVFCAKDSLSVDFFKNILSKKKISLDKTKNGVQIVPVPSEPDLVNGFLNNTYQNVVVSYPAYLALCRKSLSIRSTIDLQKEYSAIVGKNIEIPISVIMVRKEFAVENPEIHERIMENLSENYLNSKNFQENQDLTSHSIPFFKVFQLGFNYDQAFEFLKNNCYQFARSSEAKKLMDESLMIFTVNKSVDQSFYLD